MNAAFVPVFMSYRVNGKDDELWDYARSFFYTVLIVSTSIVILEILFAPTLVRFMAPGFASNPAKFKLTVTLTQVMAPYLICVSIAALFMGALNSLDQFVTPALGPIFFNLAIILSVTSFGRWLPTNAAMSAACGVLLGGFLQFAIQIPEMKAKGMDFSFRFSLKHPAVLKTAKLLAPGLLGMGVVQISLFVDSLMASFLKEGCVSYLYYADRVVELVLGIFVISFATVVLPDMAKAAQARAIQEVKSTLLFSYRMTMLVAIPATVGLCVFARPIVHVLFERGKFGPIDTNETAVALACYGLGLFFVSALRITTSAFYATEDTKTPVQIGALMLLLNVVLNALLMFPFKQGGIALATSIASGVGFYLHLRTFQKRYGMLEWELLKSSFVKISLASLAMGVMCPHLLNWVGFNRYLPIMWKTLALFAAISGGLFTYLLVLLLLKADDLNLIRYFQLWSRRNKS